MTSRGKNVVRSYETEIEKSREESNWKKAVELAQQLKARSPQHESLAHFLIGEGKLEAYLEEWPPSKENIERAQRELSDSRGYLTLATDEAGKRAGVALDSHLLLGKLSYACGSYDEALKQFSLAELNTLTEKELPLRSLRIVAESYAIKGFCLELAGAPSSSRYKQAEKDNEMIRSFELASELTLLYLQRTTTARAGPTLETALQRVPILHIRAGRLQSAIDRYRDMLTAVESVSTQALRLTLTRQLAEVLMRGVTGQVYKAPEMGAPAQTAGPWKPRKYASINQFVPRSEYEEVVLLLLVGEAMAVRGAVLSQSAEFLSARAHSLRAAVAVADLLALAAVRWGQLALLLESLERAMKFSFGDAHVWRQRALATAAAAPAPAARPPLLLLQPHYAPGSGAWSAGVRARAVSRRAAMLAPRDAALRLVAATTCYQMGWVEDGIELAEEALAIEDSENGSMLARACLYCGIGHLMKAQKTNSRIEKEAAHATSLKLLLRAVQLDDNDHLAFYYLARQYMAHGMLNEAMDATRACLSARAECSGGLRLATVLWSCACAGARGLRALSAARLAREHYPNADWPLWSLAALQLLWDQGEAALATGKELLTLLNSSEDVSAEHNGYAELDALSDSHDDTHSVRDAASVRAESAGAYRAERTLSECASSACASACARAPRALCAVRARAWLLLADLCLRLDRVSAAAGCVSEAAALMPFSHLVLYTRGLVHAASSEWEEARQCFQNALAIHPTHLDSIVQLGAAYYNLGWLRLAEKCLREAAQLEPARADTWRRLALVLAALGEPAAAADCACAALALHPQVRTDTGGGWRSCWPRSASPPPPPTAPAPRSRCIHRYVQTLAAAGARAGRARRARRRRRLRLRRARAASTGPGVATMIRYVLRARRRRGR
ncbi:tetratricopeptide repeat protein 7B [Plodia interpunctella]|uniref:tetratricopeptide repeat protein 7B n=1 Tax=Plodia interpunctella TaxID=58824 RepID=UPI0023688168|nr:tetratricopeptide repeat protein 7B [Plodia interpunctella]